MASPLRLLPLVAACMMVNLVYAHDRLTVRGPHDVDTARDALVALASLSALVACSVGFELLAERVHDRTALEPHAPFVRAVSRELATLGLLGLLLFAVSTLDVLPRLSLQLLGERDALRETIERLHMALFFFLVVFLALCGALLRLGVRAQREWRAFERDAESTAGVVADFVLATEPPRSWRERLSLARLGRRRRAQREMDYAALRRRFVDLRSNHPDPVAARRLAKPFQLPSTDVPFPFHEYLSAISGEVMARLIEIDVATWAVLELCLAAVVAACWGLGPRGEVGVLLAAGFALVALNEAVHRRIRCMRVLLTPTRLLADAERLRRDNAWRTTHGLPLTSAGETSSLLEEAVGATRDDDGDDFAPPYIATLPGGGSGRGLSETALARRQRMLLGGGRGNGVRLAVFVTRLVFLLTAMHLATFVMRTRHQLHAQFAPLAVASLSALFLLPSVLVTVLSVRIARDGLYAFSVEHLKVHRVAARVMRRRRARETLRTLRFVAEMKIYLRDSVARLRQADGAPPLPSEASARAISRAKSSLPERAPVVKRRPITHAATTGSLDVDARSDERRRPRGHENDWNEMDRRDVRAIFCLFDVDGSGCVSRDEMATLLLAITHELDAAQLGRLMDDLVDGGDAACDEITFECFDAWCRSHMRQCAVLREHVADEIFGMIDADASGFITVDEFVATFETLGHVLDHDDVRELVYQMDRNADGKIDAEEFAAMLRKHAV